MGVFFRVVAILAIVFGFVMRFQGYPEGDSVIKGGMLLLALTIALSLIRISRHSRGTP